MDKFWEWFKKKHFIDSIILESAKIRSRYFPEKLLITFMLEFCLDYNIDIDYHLNNKIDISDLFVYLQDSIEQFAEDRALYMQEIKTSF